MIFNQSSKNVFEILILSEKGVVIAVKFRPEVFRDSRNWVEACSTRWRSVNTEVDGDEVNRILRTGRPRR